MSEWINAIQENSERLFAIVQKRPKQGFFEKLFAITAPVKQDPSTLELKGRIQRDALKDVNHIAQKLNELRSITEKTSSKVIAATLESFITPLLREFNSLEKKLKGDLTQPCQFQATLTTTQAWVEKAKKWLGEVDLPQVLLEESQESAKQRIDKDLKMLEDYLANAIHTLQQEGHPIEQFSVQIQREIGTHVKALHTLKKEPVKGFDNLATWQAQLTHARARHTHAALGCIDSLRKYIRQQ